jgi:hypothetical protein
MGQISFRWMFGVASKGLMCLALTGCAKSITIDPPFQPLPTLSVLPTPDVRLDDPGFRFCYRDQPCTVDVELAGRYRALVGEFFPSPDPPQPIASSPVRVVTEMQLVDDHRGRLFSYGLLFGPLAVIAPIPYPMALDFVTTSTTLDEQGRPIRTYHSRELVEFWTYSAWGLRDPQLAEAAMRHHLRALTRHLQFDAGLYQPLPLITVEPAPTVESPALPQTDATPPAPS